VPTLRVCEQPVGDEPDSETEETVQCASW
jgi:hypothetical protein